MINNKGETIKSKDVVKFFGSSPKNIKKLGINKYSTDKLKKINEIKDIDLGMVCLNCVKDAVMTISGNNVRFTRGKKYIMPMNYYTSSKKDKNLTEKIFKPNKTTFTQMFKRYNGENLNGKSILISRTGGLGDIVVLGGLCEAIKDKYPHSKLTFCTSPGFVGLLTTFKEGLIDEAYTVPYEDKVLEKNDYHIFLIHAIENCLESKYMNFFEVFQKISGLDYDPKKYITKLYSIKALDTELKKHIKPNTIIFHMRSSTKLRSLDLRKWIDIMNICISKGYNIGIVDKSEEYENINTFLKNSGLNDHGVQNLANLCKTPQHLVSICNVSLGGICIDSGVAHIMSALRKPLVGLCGPYDAYHIGDYYPKETSVYLDSVGKWNECGKNDRGCGYNSQESSCPFIASNLPPGCLNYIDNKLIVDSFEKVLNNYNEINKNVAI